MKIPKFHFKRGRHTYDDKRADQQSESTIPAATAIPMLCLQPELNIVLEEQILADSQERSKRLVSTESADSEPSVALPSQDNVPIENPEMEVLSADESIYSKAARLQSPTQQEEEDSAGSPVSKEPSTIPQPPSLLDNSAYVKLVEECVDVMDEFERFIGRLESEEAKTMAGLVVQRLQESLERSGLTRISDEENFAILRHIPVPMVPVVDGAPLAETLVSGLAIENRVFRKAKVTLKPIETR